jgi:imidazoleglycerol-phosphate dehydratase/histidinol-phosphatase
MKTLLIDPAVLNFNSSRSDRLISGLLLLQSKGLKLFVDSPLIELEPLVLKIFQSEKIDLYRKDQTVTYDFIITSQADSSLVINNIANVNTFYDAVVYINSNLRNANISRKTRETDISIIVSLDSNEESTINTGIGFFDHMLSQIARHGNIHLEIKVTGDLEVDEHHTVEDTGIALGTAIAEALGNKAGIRRYGFFLPMDDCVAYCALDLGGRIFLKFNAKFNRTSVGGLPTELVEEFFRALSSGMKANIHLKATGKNDHHKIESLFKAFAKALNDACRIDQRASGALPSTKGIL